jgi:hypothetical protein
MLSAVFELTIRPGDEIRNCSGHRFVVEEALASAVAALSGCSRFDSRAES